MAVINWNNYYLHKTARELLFFLSRHISSTNTEKFKVKEKQIKMRTSVDIVNIVDSGKIQMKKGLI